MSSAFLAAVSVTCFGGPAMASRASCLTGDGLPGMDPLKPSPIGLAYRLSLSLSCLFIVEISWGNWQRPQLLGLVLWPWTKSAGLGRDLYCGDCGSADGAGAEDSKNLPRAVRCLPKFTNICVSCSSCQHLSVQCCDRCWWFGSHGSFDAKDDVWK